MARLCVRVAPNSHPTDAKIDPLRTQVGDVVCIVDDKHEFSHCEMNNGQYKIIDMPGVPQEKLIYLCEHAEDADGNMIQRRIKALDINAELKIPELPKDAETSALTRDELLKQADQALAAGDKQAYLDLTAQADAIDKTASLAQYTDESLASIEAVTIDKPVIDPKIDPQIVDPIIDIGAGG